ncbi:xanthine dehydrogenase small subunit [Kocuria sp. M1R5S2]|uniref:xanthine dehydrogenase small subunit n=1 Tax=Kocuria rhizosphaerae TaxID=3376285 RepID=UPI0037B3131C
MEGIRVTVNGRERNGLGAGPHTRLLDWLRAEGLTGAKEGCAEGECGACAVLVARPDGPGRSRWTAVNACLPPAAAFDGQEVVTAEGLGTAAGPGTAERLHPVQREMAERGGSQCGFCTPGFVCAMAAEYYRPDRHPDTAGAPGPGADTGDEPFTDPERGPDGFDLHALGGNLCRCTGYRPIRDAAHALGAPREDDALGRRRTEPAPAARPTRLASGGARFVRPASLAELLAQLGEHPGAQVVAGSTDTGVEVNLRHDRPRLVLAVDRLDELRRLEFGADRIEIGAALTLSELERELAGRVPLLAQLLPRFASRLIRNAATLGGNLGTGSPVGDAAPALLALEASVLLASAEGEREVGLDEFWTGYRRTVRRPGEVIRAVRIPLPLAPHAAFAKVAKRRLDDISAVAVGIAVRLEAGSVAAVRIGLGGVAATPLRARATEEALAGRPWTRETADAAAAVLSGEGTPIDDVRATARYRSAVLGQALPRFWAQTRDEAVSR